MTESKIGEQHLISSSEQLVPPNCIRSVQIHNRSIWNVHVVVHHRSGHVTKVPIQRGSSQIIERDSLIGVNHVFDPIKEGKVYRGGFGLNILLSFNDSTAHGIENSLPKIAEELSLQNKQKIRQVTFNNGSKYTVKAVVQLSVRGIVELIIEPETHKTVTCLLILSQGVPQYIQYIEYGILAAHMNEETTKVIFTFDTAGGKGGSIRDYYIDYNLDVHIKQPRN